jgi:putative transposase
MAERALYTAAQLAAMMLPGLPGTERGVRKMAARDAWGFEARGRKRLHDVTALPAEAQRALALRQAASSPAPSLPDMTSFAEERGLKQHQRRRLEARAAILAHVDGLVRGGFTRAQSIEATVAAAREASLPAELMAALRIANARGNARRTLSRATLFVWWHAREAGIAKLAPKAAPEAALPPWAEDLLALHNRPSKPSLSDSVAALGLQGHAVSYGQARRFLDHMSSIDRAKGRLGPREMKSVLPFVRRDVANLKPGSVFIGDGHTFKAEVAHPVHGRPFRPEITSILDVRTRRWVGWSAALSENTHGIADALRHAVTSATMCNVFYYDNGPGAKNHAWDEELTGLAARLGITKLHSAPYASQSRGVVERFHATVQHRFARTLPTYVGARMDKEARQAVFRITRREVKANGASRLLVSWDEFKTMVERERDQYNARPHSSLATTIDHASGKRRHQSPDEAWANDVRAGWTPEPLSAEDAADLFRPTVQRQVARGTVTLFNNVYFHQALAHHHGATVAVGYDIHDPMRVVVRMLDGRMICVAEWNANARDYIPVAFDEAARQRRLQGRLKRLESHREEAIAEAMPMIELRRAPAEAPPSPREVAAQQALERALEESPPAAPDPEDEKRRRFRRALALEEAGCDGEDRAWLDRYRRLPEYRALKAMHEAFGDEMFA